jgi:hypothetical protein
MNKGIILFSFQAIDGHKREHGVIPNVSLYYITFYLFMCIIGKLASLIFGVFFVVRLCYIL